jgi:uncharacterized protein (TIGR03066 family)
MRALFAGTLLLLSLGFIQAGGGGAKVKDLIVGKWEGKEDVGGKEAKMLVEFTKKGDLKASISFDGMDLKVTGKYKFIDDKNIEVDVTGPDGKSKTEKNKIEKLTEQTLILIDPDGKKVELKRVK